MKVSCLILAAGVGSRLGHITKENPKCMVKLFGKSLIEHQIETLVSCNVKRIGIATGYLKEKFKKLGFPTYYNPDFASTNMVESLFKSVDFFNSLETDLLISYGDIVFQKKNLIKLLDCNADFTVMIDKKWLDLWSVRNENPLIDAETLRLDKRGDIVQLGKKPKNLGEIEGQYTGLFLIRKNKISKLIDFYKKMNPDILYDGRKFKQMFMTSFLQSLIDHGWKIRATQVCNGWLEVDTITDIKNYENLFKKGLLKKLWNQNE